ncbi:hypothetical protein ACTJJ7_27850, partial [Phyllobacterium sp. 22229]
QAGAAQGAVKRCKMSILRQRRNNLRGNIGTADRLDFTAIGPAVNLVSRLEGLCRPLGHTVLLSGAFAAETAQPLTSLGKHQLRGIAAPCAVFTPAQ